MKIVACNSLAFHKSNNLHLLFDFSAFDKLITKHLICFISFSRIVLIKFNGMLNIYNVLVNLAKLIGKCSHIITNIASISFHNTKLTKIGLSIRLSCDNLRSLVFNFCFHLNSRERIGDNKLWISSLGRLLFIRITMEETLLHKVVSTIPLKNFIIGMTI